jgi:DNA invertase Pin-like site-specific DNA recombinase
LGIGRLGVAAALRAGGSVGGGPGARSRSSGAASDSLADLRRARGRRGGRAPWRTGLRLGRKPTLTSHQQREAIKRVNTERETLGEIARSYNVSRWTISRLLSN